MYQKTAPPTTNGLEKMTEVLEKFGCFKMVCVTCAHRTFQLKILSSYKLWIPPPKGTIFLRTLGMIMVKISKQNFQAEKTFYDLRISLYKSLKIAITSIFKLIL